MKLTHVRRTENGTIALEIEWNNKDPFFDRDLENFQRIHKDGVISAGCDSDSRQIASGQLG